MKKIYLLGDDEDFLKMIQLILRKKYIVKSSGNINYIHVDLAEFIPDLALVDHYSEIKDSQKIISNIIRSYISKSVPFILFSGSQDAEKRANDLGAAGYIIKPSSGYEIQKYIDNFFETRSKDDQVII